MKELGEYLKETRISNGVSIEEAAEDNNLSKTQLENIENGNVRAFKDVYKLREYIKMYSKYLGLEPSKVAEEFNDFLFEHTSKISLDDIVEAKKQIEKNDKKISSPYTKEYKLKKDYTPVIFKILLMILIMIVVYMILTFLDQEPNHKEVLIKDMEEYYEFTY